MIFLVRCWVNAILLCCAVALTSGCVSLQETEAPISEPVLEQPVEVVVEPPVESEKELIGRKELVTVLPQDLSYDARIDTGAAICSICAFNIKRFERDGKKWVQFQLPGPDNWGQEDASEGVVMEFPLVRNVYIRRHRGDTQKRPTVKLLVRMGPIEDYVEFSLVDRSNYEFPLLVGRNFLEGYAIVDVSRSYVVSSRQGK